jgi:hypothetical protein
LVLKTSGGQLPDVLWSEMGFSMICQPRINLKFWFC